MSCERLEKLIDDEGLDDRCEGCRFYREWTEWYPYGDTEVSQKMYDCEAGDDRDCPRLQE